LEEPSGSSKTKANNKLNRLRCTSGAACLGEPDRELGLIPATGAIDQSIGFDWPQVPTSYSCGGVVRPKIRALRRNRVPVPLVALPQKLAHRSK
jgi:hypothetical protein